MKFKPEPRPRVLKTNIAKISQFLSRRITQLGYNVYISFSNKSNSRYLEVKLSKDRKLVARIADHHNNTRDLYNFDIYTNERRNGAVDYIEFLDAFKQIIGGSHA